MKHSEHHKYSTIEKRILPRFSYADYREGILDYIEHNRNCQIALRRSMTSSWLTCSPLEAMCWAAGVEPVWPNATSEHEARIRFERRSVLDGRVDYIMSNDDDIIAFFRRHSTYDDALRAVEEHPLYATDAEELSA